MKLRISLIFLLVLSSCSLLERERIASIYSYQKKERSLAEYSSNIELGKLIKYLEVDKLHYYIVEYVNSHGKNLDPTSINILKSISPQFILDNYTQDPRVKDAHNYDDIIVDIVKSQNGGNLPSASAKYKWGYNFFRNKLNEAYNLGTTRIGVIDNSQLTTIEPDDITTVSPIDYQAEDLTLDSDHYISNRTTRAIMWEANETGRDVEFHLENPREFLNNLSESGATIIAEVNPLAKNYNKMYVVQYPGEDTFRYAFTNVGGEDRLKHLLLQFNLTELVQTAARPKVRFFGNIQDMQQRMTDEFTGIFKHLPKVTRTFIGQKGAIERFISILWKTRAILNFYGSNEANKKSVLENVAENKQEKFKQFMQNQDIEEYDILKNKKIVEAAFDKLKGDIEEAGLLPDDFKRFDYDNFVISMADFEFQNSAGENIVWRVAANSWGDEITPLAKALDNISVEYAVIDPNYRLPVDYAGTAGTIHGQVGDLVIPQATRYNGVVKPMTGTALDIDGAIVGGTVDYVYSPFVETNEWLDEAIQNIEYVEVETGHLNDTFGSNIDYTAYLLISDKLGSEGETLASAEGSRRRNSLNKLLYAYMARDKVGVPNESTRPLNKIEEIRRLVDRLYGKKGKTFQHYLIASLLEQTNVTEAKVKQAGDSISAFSDTYFAKRLTQTSEIASFISRKMEDAGISSRVFINKDFVDGVWHPKEGKVQVYFHGETEAELEKINSIIAEYENELDAVKGWSSIRSTTGPPNTEMVSIPKWVSSNSDYLVALYSQAAFRLSGLDAQVTYNGNIKFNFLSTNVNTPVCEADKFCHLSFFGPDDSTKDLLSQIDTDQKLNSKINSNFDSLSYLNEKVQELNEFFVSLGKSEGFAARIEVVDDYELDGSLAEIVPTFNEGKGLVIEVRFAPGAKNNPLVVLEEVIHLEQMMYTGFFKHPIYWAELAASAEQGSYTAKFKLIEAEEDALAKVETKVSELGASEEVNAYFIKRKKHLKKIKSQVRKKRKAQNDARKNADATWAELKKNLEAEDVKLDGYIAQNNRTKVAELISAYMPWGKLEPTERNVWLHWLNAMRNPGDDLMVTFRGLGDDLVKETPDGGHFLMAKMLTKNQGSYTRRLRSLNSFFKKRLSKQVFSMPVDIQLVANSFKGHSNVPHGSPYLSTSVYHVANSFAGDQGYRIAAIKIDARRNLLNLVSGFDSEVEQIIPLIVFPDEIIHIDDGESDSLDDFLVKTEENLGRPLTEAEKDTSPDYSSQEVRIKNTREWWFALQPKDELATEECQQILNIFSIE